MDLTGMPPATAVDTTVSNNGFYPDLALSEFIQNYAIATQYGNTLAWLSKK